MSAQAVSPIQSTKELLDVAYGFKRYLHDLAPINTATGIWQMMHLLTETIEDGNTMRDVLWARHMKSCLEMRDRAAQLGGDFAKAGAVLYDALEAAPSKIDQNERFFFMAAYLEHEMEAQYDHVNPEVQKKMPFHAVRDLIGRALDAKASKLYEFHKAGIKVPPSEWGQSYSELKTPHLPAHINMMLCNFNVYRYLGHGDAGDRAGDVVRIYNYLTGEVGRGQPGCLLSDESYIYPADLKWAWERQGRQFLLSTSDSWPDHIWPEYA